MTGEHPMVFINLPVMNVARSRVFFAALGYAHEAAMSDDNAAAFQLGPNIFLMIIDRTAFGTFGAPLLIEPEVDGVAHRSVLTSLAVPTRAEVDRIVDAALAAGGRRVGSEERADATYCRSYADLDGHVWEIFFAGSAAGSPG